MNSSLIVAYDNNKLIGNGDKLPWPSIKEDMNYFKEMTTGKIVVMGKNTYYSIPEKFRPLKDRFNIVITSSILDDIPNILDTKTNVCRMPILDIDLISMILYRKINIFKDYDDEIVFIGGRSIYEYAMQVVDNLYVTQIYKEYDGDVYFPAEDLNYKNWKLESKLTLNNFCETLVYKRSPMTTYEKELYNMKQAANKILSSPELSGEFVKKIYNKCGLDHLIYDENGCLLEPNKGSPYMGNM